MTNFTKSLSASFEHTHIDTWLDMPMRTDDMNIRYARFMFVYFRLPAHLSSDIYPFMREHRLLCTFQGKEYRVTGASRLGDIWLHSNFEKEVGYELRVFIDQVSNFRDGRNIVNG